jgi:hypothetical protein
MMRGWQDISTLVGEEVAESKFPWSELLYAAINQDIRKAESILKDDLGIILENVDWHLAAIRIRLEATGDRFSYKIEVKVFL